eukprot:2059044-Amphidinium_carterae.1
MAAPGWISDEGQITYEFGYYEFLAAGAAFPWRQSIAWFDVFCLTIGQSLETSTGARRKGSKAPLGNVATWVTRSAPVQEGIGNKGHQRLCASYCNIAAIIARSSSATLVFGVALSYKT